MLPRVYIGIEWFGVRALNNHYLPPKECGASVIFLGIARSAPEDGDVRMLFYEAYEEMAIEVMSKIRAEAIERFGLIEVFIHHRIGQVNVGEESFMVAVFGSHRAECFKGCEFVVNEVKLKAPIWKKEIFGDRSESWVS
ncbi:MAG: molybdenum cofactor biosynthesis protein MoaE [Aquificaceae bacterium]